jgi:hypothetical protein
MKYLLLLLLFDFSAALEGAAQSLPPSAAQGTAMVSPVARLAHEITKDQPGEKEKVAAIFHWITGNISYKVSSRISSSYGYRRSKQAPEPVDEDILKPLNERVAEGVLERGEAVCDGYARLFKTLCDYAGIRAEIVSGYARTGNGGAGRNFRSNHSWNAVMIDSAWHLLDATWAAGYLNFFGDTFIRHYDSRYFMAPPRQFIQDHYPEDPFWALLPDPPVLSEFNWAPYRHSGFVRSRITAFLPAKGIVEAAVGDTITFELETGDAEKNLEVWDRPFGDPRLHTSPVWTNYPERPAQTKGKKVTYQYTVGSAYPQWLYVVYNGEPVLQYRLQVRATVAQTAGTSK